ncbi:MAG TPA: hemolysin family protein [Chryseosolibacter sp.]
MDFQLLPAILISLAFSIFFSGIEVAFLSSNKVQIELLGRMRNPAGMVMAFFVERPTWFIGTTLVGNIMSLLLFAYFGTKALLYITGPSLISSTLLQIAVAALLSIVLTLIILYSVEFLSKGFFVINSNRVLVVLAIPFALVAMVLFPFVYIIISLAKFISVNVMKLEYSMDKPVFGLTDVSQYLKSIHHEKSPNQNIELDTKIFTNALEFKSVRVRDCMIPRTEVVAVSLDSGIKKLHEAFIESGHSKIIIFRDSIDDVIGYCHSSALFKKPAKIEDILTPIITVPETTLAKDLMVRFINERKSLASVIDEFGGTSGIVSMEDVIEEIFGEIEDEHDEQSLVEQRLNDTTYYLSARLEVDYLNEKYGWQLPVGDYETLGGLILSYAANIPKSGQTVAVSQYKFIIHSTSQNRINTVRLILPASPEGD